MAPIKNTQKRFIGNFVSKIGVSTSILNLPSLVAAAATSSTQHIFSPGNGFQYHIFHTPGKFYVFNPGYFDIFIVAGGGGGGAGSSASLLGGGGGAGGVITKYNVLMSTGFYDICVGTGGASSTSSPNAEVTARNGSPSFISGPPTFTTLTAIGGGHGGCGPNGDGIPGGSGGGASAGAVFGGSGTGTGLNFQGSTGGASAPLSTRGAPGGGASETLNVNTDTNTNGGRGIAAFGGVLGGDTAIPSITGATTPFPGRWFAAGGGGSATTGATGGTGGGGPGASSGGTGTNATWSSGSGGGGGGGPGLRGGSGAPGTVIIRYRNTTLPF